MSASASAPGPSGADGGGLDRGVLAVASVVVLGAIMSILDTTIVNIAIDHLSRDFDAPITTVQWVATGYLLALATVIPLTGWAADRFGTKRLYITSLVLFVAGSALCGAAWSIESLIGFRILQGLGGGMIMPAGMTILAQAAGPSRIGRIMSVVGVPMLLGPILGPVLGGWLVDDVSWRWIFFVNIPIGAVALALAWRILPKDKPQHDQRLDVLGLALLSPGLALAVFGLAETSGPDGFGAPKAYVPIAAGLLLIAAFTWHALRTRQPLIDLRLFRRRGPGVAAVTMMLFATAFFGSMFLLPLYYQVARGQDALAAALLLIPQGIGAALMMPIAGRVVDKVGARRIVLPGLVLIAGGMAVFTQVGADTNLWLLRGASFVMGLGMGATMMPTMSAAYVSLTHAEVARATTALNIIQRVGGALGTALLSVVLANQLADRLPTAGGSANALEAAQTAPASAQATLSPLVADAFAHTFVWAFVLLALAAIPAWFLPRGLPKPAAPPGEGAEAVERTPTPV